MAVAIVGHGSIGSRHKLELLNRGFSNKEIIIIERNDNLKKA